MFYAVRLEIPDPFYFLDLGEKKYIFLDHREYGVFQETNQNPNIELVALESLYDEIKRQPGGLGAGKLGLAVLKKYGLVDESIEVAASFPVAIADYLRQQGITLQPVESLYPERILKTSEEVQLIQKSLLNTQEAFKHIEDILAAAKVKDAQVFYKDNVLTSEFLKIEAEKVLLEKGMFNVEGIIISSGPQAAIPHHRGSGEILPGQTIVCDIFPKDRISGFFADMTRTYCKGQPSLEAQKMYTAVHKAQQLAFNMVQPGVSFGEIHEAVVQFFYEQGYPKGPEGFTHSLGHGLGLDVHELPFVGKEEKLKPGQVITIEPGLYYKAHGGVRIEDVVLVTESGYKNLTNFPNCWVIA